MIIKSLTRLSIAALAVGLVAGCAVTKEDLEAVRVEAQQASATANNAQATADQALRAAQDAQACCRANEEKFDRMFRRSMMK